MSYCPFSGGEYYKNHFQPGIYVMGTYKGRITAANGAQGRINEVCCGKCGKALGHEFLYDGPKEGLSRF
uniref:peptide-methionine (R)-S-oxide reductase n=1 Tax=Oryzias latipes TaxID=8090 RepID=A0A3P9HFB9_ORYLA